MTTLILFILAALLLAACAPIIAWAFGIILYFLANVLALIGRMFGREDELTDDQ